MRKNHRHLKDRMSREKTPIFIIICYFISMLDLKLSTKCGDVRDCLLPGAQVTKMAIVGNLLRNAFLKPLC
ncbi:MAG: hypothetical protein WC156_11795, partial [Pedobacter sp.]